MPRYDTVDLLILYQVARLLRSKDKRIRRELKKMLKAFLLSLALLISSPIPFAPLFVGIADAQVRAESFQIVEWHWYVDNYGYAVIVGELQNNGSIAASAELQLTMRDGAGKVLDTKTFWTGSVNIAPAGRWPIKTLMKPPAPAANVELRVIKAQVFQP